jgi:tRNA(Ile)-lysidine synthase
MLNRWSNIINDLIIEKGLFSPNEKILITVSGGQDSMLLLTLLTHLQPFWNWQLAILHCDHRWQSNSFIYASQIYRLAFIFKKPIYIVISTLNLINETNARLWRYSNIYQICKKNKYASISLGHTKSDKLETLLLNCLRGTGLKGLESIKWKCRVTVYPSIMIWYDKHHKGNFIKTSFLSWSKQFFCSLTYQKQQVYKVRPLLDLSRDNIRIAIQDCKIPLCVDYTNYNINFRRNRIRHQLIPYLKLYFNPKIELLLNCLSEIIHSDNIYLNAVIHCLCKSLVHESKADYFLAVDYWQSLPIALQRRILLQLLSSESFHTCSFREIEKIRLTLNKVSTQSNELIFESKFVQLTLFGPKLRIQRKSKHF